MSTSPDHCAAILAAIEGLPSSVNPTRKRLELVTRAFLETAHCAAAFELGWTDAELFGIAPSGSEHRVDQMGVVTSLALSKLLGPRLESITADRAITRYSSGSRLTSWRARPGDILGIPWWKCEALGGPPLLAEIAA